MRYNHTNKGGYRPQRRYYGSRNRGSRFSQRSSTISIDKLIAKAVDTEPVNMFVDDYNYSQFDIHTILKNNIYSKGYSNPTKIQYQAIPEILKGKDILGIASTGSGKTAAFLIPMINKLMKDRNDKCLIVEPTRELAIQIQDEFRSLSRNTGLKSVLIMGGNSMKTQINVLRTDPEFVICTPGRLKDLTDRGYLNLSYINNVVLDEVDRMLDMGFIADIRFIIQKLNKERQSLFFSATMDRKSEEIANTLLLNPIKVEVEVQGPGKNVDQDVVRLEKDQNKGDVLLELLTHDELKKVLIFTSTKREADRLCKRLLEKHIYVEALHGDKRQNQRTKIIDKFKKGFIDVLIATDVASRGLDVNNITHVINYDMPQNYDDYIHRIGRTGRAGKKGYALTFV
mgnify:FL=1